MGFGAFIQDATAAAKPSIELYYQLQCKVCPLNKIKSNKHPHMEPTGTSKPVVYMLGEAPGENEDLEDEQFVGLSGQVLRARIPKGWNKKLRWNNVVRTRPPKNRVPTEIEIECCRPSIVADIEATKPKAIFGFGATPLHWVAGLDRILLWRGRKMPVRVGKHECWYYPMLHPAFLLWRRKKPYWIKEGDRELKPTFIGSEEERMFVFDLQRAFDEVEDLPWPEVHDEETARYGVETLDGRPGDLDRLEKLLAWAAKQHLVGVDYETNGIRPYADGSKILTAAVGTDELSFAFAIRHRQSKWSASELEEVERLWVRFLRAPKVRKASHFLAFEMEWSAYFYGADLLYESLWDDTATQSSVIDERLGQKGKKAGPLSLEWLVQQYFGFNLKAVSNLNRAKLDDEPLPEVLTYNAMDAKYHCLLFQKQQEVIADLEQNKQYRHCLARVPTCVMSQLKGVPTNPAETKRLKKLYTQHYKEAAKEIAISPEVRAFERKQNKTFNPESHPDVTILFKDQLKFKQGWQEDKHGEKKYSVDKNVLEKINHPVGNAIVRLREAGKLLSYIYDDYVWPDGLIHTSLNTLFVATKRLSSNDPNLQNAPKRDEEGKEVRKQIEAEPGDIIVAIDYGQIQGRGIAMTSGDKAYIQALWERYDVHGDWAERVAYAYPARVGGKQYIKDKDVMKKFRDEIKNKWTFPLFFGSRMESCANDLKVPESNLAPEHKKFVKMFQGVFEWHERQQQFYKDHGYVEDLFGLRRHGPLSVNRVINSPIQMLEGVIVMDAMSRLSRRAYELDDINYQPNIQIHDDLTTFLPEDFLDKYVGKIVELMLDVKHFKFINVPITLEVSIGKSLFKMTPVLDASSDGLWNWKI